MNELNKMSQQELRIHLANVNGVYGHPKEPKLWKLAWEQGHANGYSEVALVYDELADLVTPVAPEAKDDAPPETPYGFCPICGAPGVSRERRPDGNDRCANNHVYASKEAMKKRKVEHVSAIDRDIVPTSIPGVELDLSVGRVSFDVTNERGHTEKMHVRRHSSGGIHVYRGDGAIAIEAEAPNMLRLMVAPNTSRG